MSKFSIIFILLLVSCSGKTCNEDQKKLILGDWTAVNPPSSVTQNYTGLPVDWGLGYTFFSDGTCEDKFGFFDWEKPLKYYGSISNYEIEDDNLKIKDLYLDTLICRKIVKLTHDSLIVSGGDNLHFYIKKKYDTIKSPDIDGVVIHMGGGLIPSYINNIYIQSTGNFIFDRYEVETHGPQYYKGIISKKEFARINTRFKKTDYLNLDKVYGEEIFDGGYNYCSLIKNNKIIRSFYLKTQCVPYELRFAIRPVTHLPDVASYKSNTHFKDLNISHFISKYKKRELELTNSEDYFLCYLLSTSPKVTLQINENHELAFRTDDNLNKITTDGRYYKFYFRDNKTETVDIGYDFLAESELVNTFKYSNE